jgi:hypothetical protein
MRGGYDNDDGHRGIPHDANGDPIFLILPGDVRANYERRLGDAKAAWLVTGDTGALRKAAFDTKHFRQPQPDWYVDAIVTILTNMRGASDVRRAKNNEVHAQRYQVVRDTKADAETATGIEISVDEACERAANKFKTLGSTEDLRHSYFKVQKALKGDLGGAFNTIHVPRGQPR